MKVRSDFVTNSSSSSYCVIGTDDPTYIEKLKESCKMDEYDFSYGFQMSPDDNLTFVGNDWGQECFIAGLDAEPLLQVMTIPQAREHFAFYAKTYYNVSIPIDSIVFGFGEAGE